MTQDATIEGAGFSGQIAVPLPLMARRLHTEAQTRIQEATSCARAVKTCQIGLERSLRAAEISKGLADIAKAELHVNAAINCLNQTKALLQEARAGMGVPA